MLQGFGESATPVSFSSNINFFISRYHALNRELAAARAGGQPTEAIEAALQALGGLPAYQHASRVGEGKGGATNTSAWVVRMLQELGRDAGPRLRLLDVGAVTRNYQRQQRWIACRGIDLHASCPGVEALDFFDLPLADKFDVVVLRLGGGGGERKRK